MAVGRGETQAFRNVMPEVRALHDRRWCRRLPTHRCSRTDRRGVRPILRRPDGCGRQVRPLAHAQRRAPGARRRMSVRRCQGHRGGHADQDGDLVPPVADGSRSCRRKTHPTRHRGGQHPDRGAGGRQRCGAVVVCAGWARSSRLADSTASADLYTDPGRSWARTQSCASATAVI
jgi:hypothetical protein